MEYTKGEWKLVKGKPQYRGQRVDGVIRSFLSKLGAGYDIVQFNKMTDQEEINAHLIAAAPDLYEACVGAMKWWAKYQDSFYPPEFTAIVKALAKAESKSQP